MTSNPCSKLPSEADALLDLRNAFYDLQHREIALDELWETSADGQQLVNPSFMDRQLKEIADQADRVRATLDLVQTIRRYRHVVSEPSPVPKSSSPEGSALKALKDGFDIATWVRGQGVELEKVGKHFVGRCPLPCHQDTYGSFTVTGHIWCCFGCSGGGSIVELLMEWKGMSQLQAIGWLVEQSDRAGQRRS